MNNKGKHYKPQPLQTSIKSLKRQVSFETYLGRQQEEGVMQSHGIESKSLGAISKKGLVSLPCQLSIR